MQYERDLAQSGHPSVKSAEESGLSILPALRELRREQGDPGSYRALLQLRQPGPVCLLRMKRRGC